MMRGRPLVSDAWTRIRGNAEDLRRRAVPVRALGAWVLHRTTLTRHSLRSFVGITSLNALLGQGSNAAIATANLVVDGLLAQRRAQGLPGLSLQFSRVADVGSNAKQPLRYASAVSAIRELSFQHCAAFLRAMLIATGPPRVPVLLADVDWRAFQVAKVIEECALVEGSDCQRRNEN
eukprot:s510_g20.t1